MKVTVVRKTSRSKAGEWSAIFGQKHSEQELGLPWSTPRAGSHELFQRIHQALPPVLCVWKRGVVTHHLPPGQVCPPQHHSGSSCSRHLRPQSPPRAEASTRVQGKASVDP